MKSIDKSIKQRLKSSTTIVTNITELNNCYFKIINISKRSSCIVFMFILEIQGLVLTLFPINIDTDGYISILYSFVYEVLHRNYFRYKNFKISLISLSTCFVFEKQYTSN